MTITARSLWQIRLVRALPRYLLYTLCMAGLLASVRFAVDPPRARLPGESGSTSPRTDLAAQGYATQFARHYLTWNAADQDSDLQSEQPLPSAGIDPKVGVQLPAVGEQHVLWAEVVQVRERAPEEHVYTVAAQTDTAGLLYLTVDVLRRSDGALTEVGYPAFVGAPTAAPAQSPTGTHEVKDPALNEVVERALHNYLAASGQDLAADLASGARVSTPSLALTLTSVTRTSWAADGRSVLAVVQAQDRRGVAYTLGYELDVVAVQGRWEITAIQMDPAT